MINVLFAPLPTTNSNPAIPGTVVTKEMVPSGFFLLATSLFHSPKSKYVFPPDVLTARDHAIMTLAFFGVRKAEQMGARWEDLDWLEGSLHIKRSAWLGQVSDGAKTENSVRKAWLHEIVMESLKRWKRLSETKEGFLFESESGTPLELGTYSTRVMRPKFKTLGLAWKAFHSGRRTSVTESRRFGDPEDLAFHFGHSIDVANKVYDKGREDKTRKALLDYGAMLSAKLKDSADAIADNSGQQMQKL